MLLSVQKEALTLMYVPQNSLWKFFLKFLKICDLCSATVNSSRLFPRPADGSGACLSNGTRKTEANVCSWDSLHGGGDPVMPTLVIYLTHDSSNPEG
jgi:hypothetical protein